MMKLLSISVTYDTPQNRVISVTLTHVTLNTIMILSKCHNEIMFHFKKLFLLTYKIILAISKCDTLTPLGI